MIAKLNHTDRFIALQMQDVFMESYAIEAEILKAVDFPPLKRPLEDYVQSENSFFGFYKESELAGVVEIKHRPSYVHIQSLVVKPSFFRKGIGQQLLNYVCSHISSNQYIVETGIDNSPAVALYLKNGFMEVKQWDTDHGIRKVKFKKNIEL